MLFHSSVRQELSRSFGAVVIVLITVVMTMTLIRTLGLASRGSLDPADVMLVMGYTVLAYMPTLLTMSLFIAIIASVSRMYKDSEMVIWLCSGRGLLSMLPALFRFAWPVLAVVAGLSLLVLPWTNLRIDNMKDQFERRSDLDRIAPGQFQESANGYRVFFVEKNAIGQSSGSNVFIVSTERGKQTITSARQGRVVHLPHGRFLMLNHGQSLERNLDTDEIKISSFEEYGLQVGSATSTADHSVPADSLSTLALFEHATPINKAELSWRFGLVMASFNFVLVGLAVSGVNPRRGQGLNMVFALFTFVVYYNLLSLGNNWIATQKITWGPWMFGLHLSVFLGVLIWLAKLHNNWHWRDVRLPFLGRP